MDGPPIAGLVDSLDRAFDSILVFASPGETVAPPSQLATVDVARASPDPTTLPQRRRCVHPDGRIGHAKRLKRSLSETSTYRGAARFDGVAATRLARLWQFLPHQNPGRKQA
jgi:hypothetical protein